MANTFLRKLQADVSISGSVVYTVPGGATAVVIGLTVANKTVNNLKVSGKVNTINFLGINTPVPAESALVALAGKMVMEAGDTLTLTASAGSSLDSVLSVMEIT